MEKFIKIKAICSYFEIYETVPDSKSVARLETILKMFQYYHKRFNHETTLKVNTVFTNPELPFGKTADKQNKEVIPVKKKKSVKQLAAC